MAGVTEPNIGTTMVLIHRAITRGLGVSIERGTEFAQDSYLDAATQEGFALYVKTLVSVLSAHHKSEDDVAFPYLRDRLPNVPFGKLIADHHVMEGILAELQASAEAVAVEAQASDSLTDLVRTATTLADLWHPHIRIEEQRVYEVGIISAVMDADENAEVGQRLGEYAQEHVQPLSLGIPFLLYNLPPKEREMYAQMLPPTLTEQLVPVVWKEQWAPMQQFLLG